jgi:hypothetical protein
MPASGLLAAAEVGDIATLKGLLAEGASISEVDRVHNSALLYASVFGQLSTCQWLLEEAGANITDADQYGKTVWTHLRSHIQTADDIALSSLLRTMTLLGDAPPGFSRRLKAHDAKIVTKGRQLRARLPSYIEQQSADIVANCPLPAILQSIVCAYAVPTHNDKWTHGLAIWAVGCSRDIGCSGAGILMCQKCKHVWYCGKKCQQADWKEHKSDCKRGLAELENAKVGDGVLNK